MALRRIQRREQLPEEKLVEKAKSEVVTAKSELDSLAGQAIEIRETISEKEQLLKKLAKDEATLRTKIDLAHEELGSVEHIVSELSSRVSQTESTLAEKEKASKLERSQSHAELENAKKQLSLLLADTASVTTKRDKLTEEIKTQNDLLGSLKSNEVQLRETLVALDKQIGDVETEIDVQKNTLADEQEKVNVVRQLIAELSKEASILRNTLSTLNDEVIALENKKKEIQSESEEELAKIQKERDKLAQQQEVLALALKAIEEKVKHTDNKDKKAFLREILDKLNLD